MAYLILRRLHKKKLFLCEFVGYKCLIAIIAEKITKLAYLAYLFFLQLSQSSYPMNSQRKHLVILVFLWKSEIHVALPGLSNTGIYVRMFAHGHV